MTDWARTLWRTGALDPLAAGVGAVATARWGPNVASLYASAAMRRPSGTAVVDDCGRLTFGQLHDRSSHTARGLIGLCVDGDARVGVLLRNHAAFVQTMVAVAKCGAVPVYLNTGFAAPQLGEVLDRERVTVLVHDVEFDSLVDRSGFEGSRVRIGDDARSFDGLASPSSVKLRPRPFRSPILLTSGTTGTPKGAHHSPRPAMASSAGIFTRIPYRRGDRMAVPTPAFHAWGLAQLTIAALLGNAVILTRRFDPSVVITMAARERATTLALVPIMLQRILACDAVERLPEMPALRIVASSGSALPAQVATAWMHRFGDNLHNVYGSTEVGQATIADPGDLRDAPGTAGRVVPGSTVRVLDGDRVECPTGSSGAIFVGSGTRFEGYTGGGDKEIADGLVSTGDVGRFDEHGRLFVEGRVDEMIISGGENLHPAEVEELIAARDDVVEAAVIGVADEEFGQRLAAFVVPRGPVAADSIRGTVASTLARHKVPRDIVFVDELPRTTTGKVRRGDLLDLL